MMEPRLMTFKMNILYYETKDEAGKPKHIYHKFKRPGIPEGIDEARAFFKAKKHEIEAGGGRVVQAACDYTENVFSWGKVKPLPFHRNSH